MKPACRLTIILDEEHTWQHRPVGVEIIKRAHQAGLAGASAFRGVEGFGASSRLHTSRILSLSEHMPVLILIIDTRENIEAFLPQLTELELRGVMTIDDVQVLHP